MARITMNRKLLVWECTEEYEQDGKTITVATHEPLANMQAWLDAAEYYMPGMPGQLKCLANAAGWASRIEQEKLGND